MLQIDNIEQVKKIRPVPLDYGKLKVGGEGGKILTLDDAIINLGNFKKADPRLGDRAKVMDAITKYDLQTMRQISEFFFRTSGIYNRIIRYMAFMYRYDWFVTPFIEDKKYNQDKILANFTKSLKILDDFNVKKQLGEIAQTVLIQGAYYGYKVEVKDGIALQELPVNYCRSRFSYGGRKPVVEFNMKFFDDYYKDVTQKMRILDAFPKEIKKGYILYKQGKLKPDFAGDTNGWYMLDPKMTVRFTVNGRDYPAFITVIPLIIDLDEGQVLDRRKSLQKLLKLVVQRIPLDKNGELTFDIEEIQQLHNNAVGMLSKAVGLDVLTTWAEVDVEDMNPSSVAESDDLEKLERQLYNEAGMSEMQFNTDGNIALEKSILNDEASMYNLLLQFEDFLNEIVESQNIKKKVTFNVQLLTTTIYNYERLAKLYKEQMQVGFSKMLPQIALGQTQSSILATAYFENEVLDLVNLFIPPLMSSTMNADILNRKNAAAGESDGAGRKELPDDQKSEKTIKNKESMS